MPVTRRYECDECAYQWTFLHLNRDEPYPDCPQCAESAARSMPTLFAITTNKAKAIDMAQKIAEEDYGMTDMNDNLREGDIAVKAPPLVQTAEAEALTQAVKGMNPELTESQAQAVKGFWQPGSSTASSMANVAAPAAAAARQLGADPVEMLHKSEKAAAKQNPRGGPKLNIVGRAKLSDAT
jgi:hypothetical protein